MHVCTTNIYFILLFVCIALDDEGSLTSPMGERMVEVPLNPMFARMLLLSG